MSTVQIQRVNMALGKIQNSKVILIYWELTVNYRSFDMKPIPVGKGNVIHKKTLRISQGLIELHQCQLNAMPEKKQ